MGYDHGNFQNRMRARELLRVLKGRITDAPDLETASPLGDRSLAYWRLSKVTGVHVYRTPDGWIGDLVFKDMPPGIGSILGTSEPRATRALAIEDILGLLSSCAERDKLPEPDPEDRILHFDFDGVAVPVTFGDILYCGARAREMLLSREEVFECLSEIRREAAGDEPLMPEALDGLPAETRELLITSCASALALKIPRFDPIGLDTPAMSLRH